MRPGPLEDPVISAIAARAGKTPAQVLLGWAVQRGTALLTTPKSAAARERILTSLPFRKTRLTKSIEFRPDRG
jgi:alcohol dehydrogenase (NADP+)